MHKNNVINETELFCCTGNAKVSIERLNFHELASYVVT